MNLKLLPAILAAAALSLTGCTPSAVVTTAPTVPTASVVAAAPTEADMETTEPTEADTATTYTEAEIAYLKTQEYNVDKDSADDLAEALEAGQYTCDSLTEEVDEYGKASTIQALLEDGADSVKRNELPAAKYLCPDLLPLVQTALAKIKKVGGLTLTVKANGSALVTYSIDGNSSQHRFSGSWTKRVDYSPDVAIVSVTATGSNKVSCRITMDGSEEASEKATGRYTSATCTYSD